MGPERETRGNHREEKELEKYREKIRGLLVPEQQHHPSLPMCVQPREREGKI